MTRLSTAVALFFFASIAATFACESETTNTGSPHDAGTADSPGGAGCGYGEPNDTRETSTNVELNVPYRGLCVSGPDGTDAMDFYSFTAPNDAAGGYVQVELTNVASSGLAEVIVTSAADNDAIFDSYQTTDGASTYGWLTVSPGATYRVQVNRFGGTGDRYSYDLTLKYTKLDDAFEPNDTKEAAKDLTVGVPIQASAAVHSPNAQLSASDDHDFYKVTLTPGSATVTSSNEGTEYLCDIQVFDVNGNVAGENYMTTPGANCKVDLTELAGGVYTIDHHAFSGPVLRGAPTKEVPTFVTSRYTLSVTQ